MSAQFTPGSDTPAATYTLDELDELEELAAQAETVNFESACKYIINVCQDAGTEVAIFGGYSLALRGSPRRTVDIDVYVKATMNAVKTMLQNEQRILRPGFAMADVYRVFVRTAGQWDEIEGDEQVVEVDLMPTGSLIRTSVSIETITINRVNIPVFDIPTMFRNKLKAYDQREAEKDLHDIQWLLDHYPETIVGVSDEIDDDYRIGFIEALSDQGTADELVTTYKKLLNMA